MGEIATIGLDLAKNVFQVHGIDAQGEVLIRCRAAPRRPAGGNLDHRRARQLSHEPQDEQIAADAMEVPISCSRSAAPSATARSLPTWRNSRAGRVAAWSRSETAPSPFPPAAGRGSPRKRATARERHAECRRQPRQRSRADLLEATREAIAAKPEPQRDGGAGSALSGGGGLSPPGQ
jgi:hypothetical protein